MTHPEMTRGSTSAHRESGNIGGWLILGVIVVALVGGGAFWVGGFGSQHPTAQHAAVKGSAAH